ncbi:MAG: zinc-ribbon domain-containing protein [Maritimibacter sp.]
MRLVCPNCGAQYEVDDRVVPDAGRDVQCSNCGHAWFQRSARALAEETDTPEEPHTPDELPSEDDAPSETVQDTPEPPLQDEDAYEDEEDEGPGPNIDMPRPALDDSVRNILEEEAAFEMQARAQDGGNVETQPDLGLDSQPDPEAERRRLARERMSRMRGIEYGESFEHEVAEENVQTASAQQTETAIAAAVAASRDKRADTPRRDVFPDIEEINSTLDGGDPVDPGNLGAQDVQGQPRNGFKRAFSVVIIIAAVALAIYMFAPQIAQAVPALKPALTAYVDAINGLRSGVEGMMQNTIDQIEDAAQTTDASPAAQAAEPSE